MANVHVYYPELVDTSFWGDHKVLLQHDTNLLEKTKFNTPGYAVLESQNHQAFLKAFVESKISNVLNLDMEAAAYHLHVDEEQHKRVLNSMPFKKNEESRLTAYANELEEFISNVLQEKVKIFNDDIWVRICRPNSSSKNDFNPCHRDVYLDFYKNVVNVYIPIVGSNEKSSLFVQEGSHLWSEDVTAVTQGGAYFKSTNKKYSVDAIVQSKIVLNMVRPNPGAGEILIFSPYLIHGCSDNTNEDTTRMSLEIRFIKNDVQGLQQESDINEFMQNRVWR